MVRFQILEFVLAQSGSKVLVDQLVVAVVSGGLYGVLNGLFEPGLKVLTNGNLTGVEGYAPLLLGDLLLTLP